MLTRADRSYKASHLLHRNQTFQAGLEAVTARTDPARHKYIPKWLETVQASSDLSDTGYGYIGRLCRDVRLLFRNLLQEIVRHNTQPREIINSLRRSYETFVIWDDDFGASSGGLDTTFQTSPEIRNLTGRVLREISECMTEGLAFQVLGPGEESSKMIDSLKDLVSSARLMENHGYDSDEGEEEMGSISALKGPKDFLATTKSLSTATECLTSLAPLFEEPPLEFVPEEKARQTGDEMIEFRPEQAFLDQILERLPGVNQALATRMARANVWRVTYCRNRQKREDSNSDGGTEGRIDKTQNAKIERTADLASQWHDSGIGTSLNATSYAATLMTFIQGGNQARRIPHLTEKARAGTPFQCWICGDKVVMTDDRAWKQHVLADLQPYICLDPSCVLKPFQTQQLWESHLLTMHSDDWKDESCPFCSERIPKTDRTTIVKHLRHHLEDIALAAMPPEINLGPYEEISLERQHSSSTAGGNTASKDLAETKHTEGTHGDLLPLDIRRFATSKIPLPDSQEASSTKARAALSCPFRKRNPRRFNMINSPVCAMQSFDSITLLKRHIRIKHSLPGPLFLCRRCKEELGTPEALEEHLNAALSSICESRATGPALDPEDGISREVQQILFSRNKRHIIDSWERLWYTLFPDTSGNIPSQDFIPPVEDFGAK